MKKALLNLDSVFFCIVIFARSFDRKQREQTEYPKGLTLPPVSACVYSGPRLAEERHWLSYIL